MTRFLVTCDGGWCDVDAEDWCVDSAGTLTFSNSQGDEMVAVFAPGYWRVFSKKEASHIDD